MRLLVQPDDGIGPVLAQVERAQASIDTTIFRLDLGEVERALEAAVGRGVRVRALVAHTNRGGEKDLRALERRMRESGILVRRTRDDLARYHGKILIVDRALLSLMLFNYTRADTVGSRSFGLVTRARPLVEEALRLFEADFGGGHYRPRLDRLVVSPLNARNVLSEFIRASQRQLLIYDPRLTDGDMLQLLQDRARQGVDVRVLGWIDTPAAGIRVRPPAGVRLHARAIVSDGRRVFLGSQSLRRPELDRRREVGAIVEDPVVVRAVKAVFEADWATCSIAPHAVAAQPACLSPSTAKSTTCSRQSAA